MSLITTLSAELDAMRSGGTLKNELKIKGPQGAVVEVEGKGEVIMLTSNNYLGFANHPRIREAQKKAVDRWGSGMGSVRFIAGTEGLHKELEAEIASFFGTEDAILYMSCWTRTKDSFRRSSKSRTGSTRTSSTTRRSSTASASARPSVSACPTTTLRPSRRCFGRTPPRAIG